MSEKMDWNWIREKLSSLWGREYWKSVEQIADTPEFQEALKGEFPEKARALPDALSRREFLKLMGASLVLAGLGGCTKQPAEKILPYVKQPEYLVPGKPLFFATAMPFSRHSAGLLVESHMGRPTKVEGNPDHPESLGATDIFSQASILSLYDPDRSQTVNRMGRISSWEEFTSYLSTALEEQSAEQGAGLRLLSGSINSPTAYDLIQKILKRFPKAKWASYDPVHDDAEREAAETAFGQYVRPIYHFDQADVILSLDADFTNSMPGSLRYAREFTKRRKAHQTDQTKGMNRLYMVEPFPSVTGSLADHRIPASVSEIDDIVSLLAQAFGNPSSGPAQKKDYPWLDPIIADLRQHAGRSIVVAGEYQPAHVQALVHNINAALKNHGKTIDFIQPVEVASKKHSQALTELVDEMTKGQVKMLIILEANPVFEASPEVGFESALEKVPFRAHIGLYENETSRLCHWQVPLAHFLESWGDTRAFDGTASIIQPLIAPFYNGKPLLEVLGWMAGEPGKTAYDLVREYWQKTTKSNAFDNFWRKSVHEGIIANTAYKPKPVSVKNRPASLSQNRSSGIELLFRPDPTVWDGRYANNAWLQELPKPITKLTWDNAVYVSPGSAEKWNLKNEDVVTLEWNGRAVWGPVWIVPGQADGTVLVHFGYGRKKSGKIGTNQGFDAYAIRSEKSPWHGSGLTLKKTGDKYSISCTQDHQTMEGRNLVRTASASEFQKHPEFAQEHSELRPPSLYPDHEYKDYAWGMAIDLGSCTGCSACVIACQSENNIPVVGKHEVHRGREMHWLRVDRYYQGGLDQPEIAHQPVPCMHCENAPCEPVCPVGATTHSPEGINEMTYNRCVGTKYCSNNCPYKVRRFNFFEYSDTHSDILQLMKNPDVTVRTRGVMEKCTFCIQRINVGRIAAKNADRRIRDGEVKTACQTACPTQAIIFGDINDPKAEVVQYKKSPLNYGILTDLNTRPRTTYLARIKNPNAVLTQMGF